MTGFLDENCVLMRVASKRVPTRSTRAGEKVKRNLFPCFFSTTYSRMLRSPSILKCQVQRRPISWRNGSALFSTSHPSSSLLQFRSKAANPTRHVLPHVPYLRSSLSPLTHPRSIPLASLPRRRSYCAFHPMALSSVGSGAAASSKPDEHRLPTNVKPEHYDLTIRTDLEKLKFDGFVVAQYVHHILSVCDYTKTTAVSTCSKRQIHWFSIPRSCLLARRACPLQH